VPVSEIETLEHYTGKAARTVLSSGCLLLAPSVMFKGTGQHLFKSMVDIGFEVSDGCFDPGIDIRKLVVPRRNFEMVPADKDKKFEAEIVADKRAR
jgi:hypothetical protein